VKLFLEESKGSYKGRWNDGKSEGALTARIRVWTRRKRRKVKSDKYGDGKSIKLGLLKTAFQKNMRFTIKRRKNNDR